MKSITVFLFTIITIAILISGCAEKQNMITAANGQINTKAKDTFSLNKTGGHYSVLQGAVEINAASGSVSKQVDISVASIDKPAQNSSLYFFSSYEFGPDGMTFDRPIDIIIKYDLNRIPVGVKESDIKVYVLNNNTWEAIGGSFANVSMHYAVARVSHFSKMGAAAPATSGEDANQGNQKGNSSSDNNNSAQIWFKANLSYYSYKDKRVLKLDTNDTYHTGVAAWWDPAPYVQYYQIRYEFNGNPPTIKYAWGYDYREQSERSTEWSKSVHSAREGIIRNLGGDPNHELYLGQYETSGKRLLISYETGVRQEEVLGIAFPEGKHGHSFLSVHGTVDDREKLTGDEIRNINSNMAAFVANYVRNWVIWIRPVTETQK
jgi:hypothetical protein